MDVVNVLDASMSVPQTLPLEAAPAGFQILKPIAGICVYKWTGALTKDTEEELPPFTLPGGEWYVLSVSNDAGAVAAIGTTHAGATEYVNDFDLLIDKEAPAVHSRQQYIGLTADDDVDSTTLTVSFISKSLAADLGVVEV